jgi:hypothetical protein
MGAKEDLQYRLFVRNTIRKHPRWLHEKILLVLHHFSLCVTRLIDRYKSTNSGDARTKLSKKKMEILVQILKGLLGVMPNERILRPF